MPAQAASAASRKGKSAATKRAAMKGQPKANPSSSSSPPGARAKREECDEDRAKRLRLVELPSLTAPVDVPENFTGKSSVTADGKIAIDRRYADRGAWEKRRKVQAPPPGGWPKPPAHWPEGVRVDLGPVVPWLPKGWGQGVKTSCVTKLQAFVNPEGKVYYHKCIVQQLLGGHLTGDGVEAWQKKFDNFRAQWERDLVSTNFAEVKAWVIKQIKQGKNFMGQVEDVRSADKRLFENLTTLERRHLPKSADDLHVTVISARRASDAKSLKMLCNVQALLTAGGAAPVWYVDEPSLAAYKELGLNAKVGGKLIPARNMALADAAKRKKACVQTSDDITSWTYYGGSLNAQSFKEAANALQAGNEAARQSEELIVSPAAAARFLLAKLRAARKPRLAGVFPVGNPGMALIKGAVSADAFILGDFFVTENSPCRFDPRMSLKEDYDYTCSHLDTHGEVLRCNRLLIQAVHETNAGGAVSERDAAGDKERENIKILQEKWPGVFHLNGKRGDTQVIMSWRRRQA